MGHSHTGSAITPVRVIAPKGVTRVTWDQRNMISNRPENTRRFGILDQTTIGSTVRRMMLSKNARYLTAVLASASLAAHAHATGIQSLGPELSSDHLTVIAAGLFVIVLTVVIWGCSLRSK